jgi:WD40 repeat protein/tRNA A-37 threonylcarbamoyl transferase component Bud32
MIPSPDPSPSRDERVNAAIAAYLEAAEAGPAPDPEAFLARHSDLAAELRAFFADREQFTQAARQLDGPPAAVECPTLPADSAGSADPPLGTGRYFGDYELLEEIARGGMGVVYKARQVSLNRLVALKMIRDAQLASAEDVRRFRTEAEAAASLDHPHIVPIYEVGEHQGQHYFSMKFLEGSSLATLRRSVESPTLLRSVAKLVATVARAVHYAHQRGILHRDLKPGNILLDCAGEPHVTDFGLAKRVTGDNRLTHTGAIVGTPSYMPPEQARAEKGLSTAADVYSLGAVLYEMLTGRPPFRAETQMDVLLQVLEREPERPRQINPHVDRDLETICLKCLEKEAARRYDSAAALADDLERWLRGEPIWARASTLPERAVKWAKRRPALAALVAVTGLAVLALLVAGAWHNARMRTLLQEVTSAKETAEDQRREAQEAARTAHFLREHAVQQEFLARRNLYFAHLNLIPQALEAGRVQQVRNMLEAHIPQPGQRDVRGFPWYHFWYLCHREQRTLRGHPAVVAIRADGKFLARPFEDTNGVGLVDLTTGRAGPFLPHYPGQRITVITLSDDGNCLATATAGGPIRVWNVGNPQVLAEFRPPQARTVMRLAFSSDGQVLAATCLAGSNPSVLLWDVAGRQTLADFKDAGGVTFAADGRLLAVRRWDGETLVVDRARLGQNALEPASLKGTGAITGCAISPDKRLVATGSADYAFLGSLFNRALVADTRLAQVGGLKGEAALWDLATRQRLHRLTGHHGAVSDVVFAPDGKTLASASLGELAFTDAFQRKEPRPGQCKLWEVASGKELFSVEHGGGVGPLAFTPDGRLLAFASATTGEVRLLETATGAMQTILRGHTAPVFQLRFTADGQTLVTASEDGAVKTWAATAGAEPVSLNSRPTLMALGPWACFTPNSHTLLYGGEPDRLVDLTTAKERALGMLGSDAAVLMPDGQTLVAGGQSSLATWDLATGQRRRTLKMGFLERVTSLALAPDGQILAAAGQFSGPRGNWMTRDYVRLWDLRTGQELPGGLPLGEPPVPVTVMALAISPDSRLLATGTDLGRISLWDTKTRQEQARLAETVTSWDSAFHSANALAFSSDGRTLASAHGLTKSTPFASVVKPGVVKLWDVATGRERAVLQGHTGSVLAVAFAPDGRTLATAGQDRTVRFWDAATGEHLTTVAHPAAAVGALAFSPDGRMLATVGVKGTVLLWHAATPADVEMQRSKPGL